MIGGFALVAWPIAIINGLGTNLLNIFTAINSSLK